MVSLLCLVPKRIRRIRQSPIVLNKTLFIQNNRASDTGLLCEQFFDYLANELSIGLTLNLSHNCTDNFAHILNT